MAVIERNIYIAQPIERVWRFLADFTTTERWDSATITTERIEGDGSVGTRYRQITRLFDQQQKVLFTITVRQPPHLLVLTGRAGRVQFVDTFELQDLGTEVRVHYTIEHTVAWPAVVMRLLLTRRLRRNADESVDRLRQVLAEL